MASVCQTTAMRNFALLGFLAVNTLTVKESYILCQMMLLHRKKNVLHRTYFKYLHETNTTVFIILSAVKWPKFHLSSYIMARVSLFDYDIYSAAALHCWEWQRK